MILKLPKRVKNRFIEDLDNIRKIYNSIDTLSVEKSSKPSIKFIYSKFIPNIILQQINESKYIIVYKVSYMNKIVHFTIYKSDSKTNFKRLLKKLTIRIIIILKYCHVDWKSCNIVLFLSNEQKKMRKNTKIYYPKHINSGFTSVSEKLPGTIFIFRKEEIDKVLIHEVIHAFGIDLINKVARKDVFYINEAYTEMYATYFNVILRCCENNINMIGSLKLLRKEYNWCLNQASKIISQDGYSKLQLFLNDINKFQSKQQSNVLSYFIFKSCLFHSFDKMINTFPITKKNNNLNIYNEVLKYGIDQSYVTKMNKLLSIHDSHTMDKSMRMTII